MTTLYITSATTIDDFKVDLVFNDNTEKIIDIGDFIRKNPHPQYNKYLNKALFNTYKIENGNIVWGDDWDLIFPIDQLYSGAVSFPTK